MKPGILLSFLLALPLLAQGAAQAPTLAPASWVLQHPEYKANPNCIFCKIIANQAPSKKVYEDDRVLAFWDIKPRAKVHLLVIPKQHVSNLTELEQLPMETRGALLTACTKVAREAGIATSGFRIIVNSGKDASQSVFHLHFHVVGGEPLPADAVRVKPDAPAKS
ncbi:MAG: histidine triad nucleotide-binding protein [Acidobacteriota bacterium]|nr:histidine triad nucleotide-binding protein [Acidobacteriota bacterium]